MLGFAFLLGLAAWILQGIWLPRLSILAFAPFVAYATLRADTFRALFWSLLAGMAVDLTCEDPMGLHALNYVLTGALLSRIKTHFSYDETLHLSLFSGLASFLSTLLQLCLLFLFDRRIPFGGKWIFTDLIGMPVIDALYAFVWLAAPLALAEKIHRAWVLFWLKKKNPSLTSH